jgi:membrane protein DedA with SNARE-associated domain
VSVGSSVLYAIARRGGRPMLDQYGPVLHINAARVARVEAWFHRYGAVAIVVGRLIPGFRTPTTVLSGLLGVPYSVFAPATAVAAVLWAALYCSKRRGQARLQRLRPSWTTSPRSPFC